MRAAARGRRLYGTDQLLVSLDRAALKPPQRPQSPGWGEAGPLHWDMPKEQLLQPEVLQRLLGSCTRIQGVLFLEDTSEAGGGFCCVDGFHRKIEEWVSSDAVNRKAEFINSLGCPTCCAQSRAVHLLVLKKLCAHR